ncbi:hypothetical protein L2W90_25580, partial [Citrobacter freundii]|nr:hypothetical protein [Citrobacter freundii]
RLIRCVCGKKIGPDPRNFNQRVSLGRNDLLIRTFPNADHHANQLNRNKGTSKLIREIAKAQEILISKKKLTSINDRLLYLSNGVLW